MRKFRRFLGLSWKTKMLLIESALLLSVATVAVAVMPFSVLQAWVTRKPNSRTKRKFSQAEIGWAVSTASRFVPRTTCLAEAVAMQMLFWHCGYESLIRVGVRKREDGSLSAHAWVESDGEVIADATGSIENYQRLSVFQ